MVMCGGRCSSRGIDWWRVSFFMRLTSRPDCREASGKQDVIRCKACSLWATGAALSAKRSCLTSLSCILVWACRRCRLKRLPSIGCLTYTPSSSSRSSVICLDIMLKRVGACTQPCFTPLVMGKGSDKSTLSLICPRASFYAAWSPSVE